jgi:hypothetical protein
MGQPFAGAHYSGYLGAQWTITVRTTTTPEGRSFTAESTL